MLGKLQLIASDKKAQPIIDYCDIVERPHVADNRRESKEVRHLKQLYDRGKLSDTLDQGKQFLLTARLEAPALVVIAEITADAAGRIVSAAEGETILCDAIRRLAENPDQVGRLKYKLASSYWQRLQDEQALTILAEALEHAAIAQDEDLIIEIHGLRGKVLTELGDLARVKRETNGFLWGAHLVWNSVVAVDLAIKDSDTRKRYAAGASEGSDEEESGALLAKLRHDLFRAEKVDRPLHQELRKYSAVEDRVGLATCWAVALNKPMKAEIADESFLRTLLEQLPNLRAHRACIRIAQAISLSNGYSQSLREFARNTAIDLRLRRLGVIGKPGFKMQQSRQLGNFIGATLNCNQKVDAISILKILHYIKPFAPDDTGEDQESQDRPAEELELQVPAASIVAQPPLNLEMLHRHLGSRRACLVEFYCGSAGTYAVVCDAEKTSLIQLGFTSEDIRSRLREAMSKRRVPKEVRPRRFDDFLWQLGTESTSLVFEDDAGKTIKRCLNEVGSLVWPDKLLNEVKGHDLAYIAPSDVLWSLPILAMPSSCGRCMIDLLPCAVVPKAAYLVRPNLNVVRLESKVRTFVCADSEDPELRSGEFCALFSASNSWPASGDVDRTLAEIGGSREAWIYAHGYYDSRDPSLERLALNAGGRLTAARVLRFTASYEGCDIHLYACSSSRAIVTRRHQSLGLAGAFLARGADFVIASRWKVSVPVALAFARQYVVNRRAGSNQAHAFRSAWLQVSEHSHRGSLPVNLGLAPLTPFGVVDI